MKRCFRLVLAVLGGGTPFVYVYSKIE